MPTLTRDHWMKALYHKRTFHRIFISTSTHDEPTQLLMEVYRIAGRSGRMYDRARYTHHTTKEEGIRSVRHSAIYHTVRS